MVNGNSARHALAVSLIGEYEILHRPHGRPRDRRFQVSPIVGGIYTQSTEWKDEPISGSRDVRFAIFVNIF